MHVHRAVFRAVDIHDRSNLTLSMRMRAVRVPVHTHGGSWGCNYFYYIHIY